MISFLTIAAVVSIGLMVGVEFAVSAFINPILLQLEDRPRAQATRLFARRLGTAMPFWSPSTTGLSSQRCTNLRRRRTASTDAGTACIG